jgi:hypothetical protein
MNKAALFLLVLGLLQISGDLLEQAGMEKVGRPLKGIGAATTVSPAPKVFSASHGLETYSTRFCLEWSDRAGNRQALWLTPERSKRIRGPYNRRNVYGAALAYGPVLATTEQTRPLFLSVVKYALCGKAPLLGELGIDRAEVVGPVRVRYEPLPGTNMADLPRVLEAPCP